MAAADAAPEGRRQGLLTRFAVPIVFITFVVMRAADRVFMKRVSNALLNPSYNLILWNMIWPLAIQIITLGYMIPYILILRRSGQEQYTWRFFLPGNAAASSMGPVPLFQLALFSLGDQINAGVQGPPSAFISQTMQSVMSNTNVFWVAIFSFIFLGTRYKQVHIIGCVLVMLSILVGLSTKISANLCTPEGMLKDECLTAYMGNDGAYHMLTGGTAFLWYAMFLVAVLPSAAGSVYKQYVLQGNDVDIIYATWWSGNFQVLWGWVCVPLLWIHLPGQDLPPGQTFQALADTFSCLLGNVPHPGDESCATSPAPMVWFAIYLCFNMSFNVLMLWLTKYISASWTTLATVLCLDLTNILGMLPFVAGGGAQGMSLNDWLATILASLALWVYNMEPEGRAAPAKEIDDPKMCDRELQDNASEESTSAGEERPSV